MNRINVEPIDYTIGFKKYLEEKFQNNNLGIGPIKEDYLNGFRGKHGPFDLCFEANFSSPPKTGRNHCLDFYFELEFPEDRILTLQLENEIGRGKKVNEGKLSNILRNVVRSYKRSYRKERNIYRVDAMISRTLRNQTDLYKEVWSAIIRRQFVAATGDARTF